jgi:hypothetical protein
LLWIPNLLMVCLAATAVLLTTLAAGKVLRGSFIALPAALTVGFILFGGLDATHHWFSALLAIIAMLVLFQGSQNWRVVLAGSLCGIVASFTQSRGATVTAGFLVYLLWQSFDEKQKATVPWRRGMLLCGAALLIFHLRPFQAYVDQHYRYVKTFPAGFEVWERRDSPQPDRKP